MKVRVDEDRCTGHGRCYALAPDIFHPDDEGFNDAIGKVVEVADEHADIIRQAIANCPENALKAVK